MSTETWLRIYWPKNHYRFAKHDYLLLVEACLHPHAIRLVHMNQKFKTSGRQELPTVNMGHVVEKLIAR